jgi:transglutaminase-like putative cysteine protease
MTHAIRGDFTYGKRLEGAPQTPAETLARRGGSCRDFAVLMAEAARSLGLAARFTSGYIYGGPSQGDAPGGGHTHAWTRVYLPDCGWTDFDPTNGIVGNHDLVRVAEVVDPRAAVPLHGRWSGLRVGFPRHGRGSRRARRLSDATGLRSGELRRDVSPGEPRCAYEPATRSPTNARPRRRCC